MLSSLVTAQLPASQRTPEDHTVSKPFDVFVINKYCVFDEYCMYLINIV